LLGTLGNLPCVFDELHKRDPDAVRQFVVMFTNGRDKLRGKSDGTLREPSGDWQTILVLGSNLSLIDLMQHKVAEEAQTYRILEFTCEQNFSGSEGDKLRRALRDNAGHAGAAFLGYILRPQVLSALREELDKAIFSLYHHKDYAFDKRHRFWVRCMACAFVAGRVANHLGILNFDIDRIMKWAIARCQERVKAEYVQDYSQTLNEALYDLWDATLVVDREWQAKNSCQILNEPRKGFHARRVRESGRMYIQRSWLRQWLTEHRINRASFVKDLMTRSIILNEAKFVTLGAGTPLTGGGQIMCFEVDMHHPAMLEAVMQAEKDVPKEEREKKPINNLIRFHPRVAASLSPPPSSE
jgi:hypothetical protein